MTAWWMSSIPVWHHGGDGEPPMSAIHREVAVESEHATLRMLLCHADQAGIGQRQRDAGVSTHESRDVGQVLVQMEDDSNGPALEQAAWGIHTIVNSNMELATRVVSIERGRDPRALTFVAFGGSGPVHGCRLAQALGIPRVILPAAAGVTAAIGLLAAEVRFDVARTYVRRLDALDPAALDAMYADMTAQATEVVRESAAAGAVTLARAVDVRYVGQGYELTVPVPSGRLDAGALARVRAAFDEIYAARYGYAQPGEPVEVVTWKLSASAGAPRVTLAKAPTTPAAGGVKGRRRAYFPETGGWVDCPVYDRYSLAAGLTLAGPAIVEERESTSVLPPGTVATVDEYASLVVEVPGR